MNIINLVTSEMNQNQYIPHTQYHPVIERLGSGGKMKYFNKENWLFVLLFVMIFSIFGILVFPLFPFSGIPLTGALSARGRARISKPDSSVQWYSALRFDTPDGYFQGCIERRSVRQYLSGDPPPIPSGLQRCGRNLGSPAGRLAGLFLPAPALTGTDWVRVTNGAAIKTDGTLVTWTPGTTKIAHTYPSGVTGKKYVGISQTSTGGWLLAIYEDQAGQTHLETFANPLKVPDSVSGNIPTETGWKKVAAGTNHAVALRSDGRVITWGDNSYHQLDMPNYVHIAYLDIAAGDGYSIGLVPAEVQPEFYPNGLIVKGRTDYGLSIKYPRNPSLRFLAVTADNVTAGALTTDGNIVTWGKPLPNPKPDPIGKGYTDLAIRDDVAFALQEPAKEILVIEPLSPGTPVQSGDGSNEIIIPPGSVFEHTHTGIVRVIAPNNTELFWANDHDAAHILFPQGTSFPATVMHYVSPHSMIVAPGKYGATVFRVNTLADYPTLINNPPNADTLMTSSTTPGMTSRTRPPPRPCPKPSASMANAASVPPAAANSSSATRSVLLTAPSRSSLSKNTPRIGMSARSVHSVQRTRLIPGLC